MSRKALATPEKKVKTATPIPRAQPEDPRPTSIVKWTKN
jgi:hypothetical protein